MDFFTEASYLALILGNLAGASFLPFAAEPIFILMLLEGANVNLVILAASFGNIAGSVINYFIGLKGEKFLSKKIFRISVSQFNRAKHYYDKYGKLSLLFSWVPVIGDPLTFVAGLFRINFYIFLLLVSLGKIGRFIILAYLILVLKKL